MDPTVAEIDSDARLSQRLIGQYLRSSTILGVSGSNRICVAPSIPLNPDSDEQYEFILPKVQRALVDMRGICMNVRGCLMKKVNGVYAKLPADEKVVPVTNTVHALFDNVTLQLGENQENYYQSMYNYKSLIRQLFRYKTNNTSLQELSGFELESSRQGTAYQCSLGRRSLYAESKQIEFLGLYNFYLML